MSHWCLEHAWRYNRGDLKKVITPVMQAELDSWPDDLRENNAWFFPLEFANKKRRSQVNSNAARTAKRKTMVLCDNRGKVMGYRCYPNRHCLKRVPKDNVRTPPGSSMQLCPECWVKLVALDPQKRQKLGFDF